MTREEAIQLISKIDACYVNGLHSMSGMRGNGKSSMTYAAIKQYMKYRQALEMAKQALMSDYVNDLRKRGVPVCKELSTLADSPENCTDVKHGYWAVDKEDVYWGNSLIKRRCSVCKAVPHFDKEGYKFILTDYCPDCGARMDGEE